MVTMHLFGRKQQTKKRSRSDSRRRRHGPTSGPQRRSPSPLPRKMIRWPSIFL